MLPKNVSIHTLRTIFNATYDSFSKEALAQPNEFNPDWDAMAVMVEEQQRMAKRIEELEALLRQPEQEPVAYCYVQKGTSVDILTFDDAPDDAVDGTIFPLYATPPKREWVDLTPEEFHTACWESGAGGWTGDREKAVRAALSKLKEKNT